MKRTITLYRIQRGDGTIIDDGLTKIMAEAGAEYWNAGARTDAERVTVVEVIWHEAV